MLHSPHTYNPYCWIIMFTPVNPNKQTEAFAHCVECGILLIETAITDTIVPLTIAWKTLQFPTISNLLQKC